MSGWLVIVSIAVIMLLFSLLRRRGGPGKYPEVVQYILYDVKLNQVLVETFKQRQKAKIFEVTNWTMNKTRIGFLSETQKKLLKDTFALTEEVNKEIRAAKKAKSESFRNLDLTKLKEMLDECRKELEDWMMTNVGQKELPPKYPSLSSFFFGER
jgi:uncharacterized protein YpuA (DUF1002 family)